MAFERLLADSLGTGNWTGAIGDIDEQIEDRQTLISLLERQKLALRILLLALVLSLMLIPCVSFNIITQLKQMGLLMIPVTFRIIYRT